jgi:hypothetical protein
MSHLENSLTGTVSFANIGGIGFPQQPINQQSGLISTSLGLRSVEQQKTAPVASLPSLFRNPYSIKSDGSSASGAQALQAEQNLPRKVQSDLIDALVEEIDTNQYPTDLKAFFRSKNLSPSDEDLANIVDALDFAFSNENERLQDFSAERKEDLCKSLNALKNTEAPALASSAPKVVQKSPFISAIENLLALSDDVFPKNEKDLVAHLQNCTYKQATAINETLIAAENVYLDKHCDKEQGEYIQKKGAPSKAEFQKGKLQELKAKASQAEAVSTPVNKKPSAYERTQQANLYIGTYNQAIDSLISQAEDKSQPLDKLKDSIPQNLKEHDKLLIATTIDEYKNDGNNKVTERLRGLKREDQSIFDKSNKYVAKLFATPLVDKYVLPRFSNKEVHYTPLVGGFFQKSVQFATSYVYNNFVQLAKKSITPNTFSQGLQKEIQDNSRALKTRVGLAGVAGTLGVLNVIGVALKTLAIFALAATLQFVASTLTAAAYLAIPVGLVVLCHFFPPAIPYVVTTVIVVVSHLLQHYYNKKQIDALRSENAAQINKLQQSIESLKNLPGESQKEERLRALSGISADSSRRCSLDDASVASKDGAGQNADAAAELAAAGQNAGDAGQNAGQNPDADQQLD